MSELINEARRQWTIIQNEQQVNENTAKRVGKGGHAIIDAIEYAAPYIGTNGNWWVGATDTGVKAEPDLSYLEQQIAYLNNVFTQLKTDVTGQGQDIYALQMSLTEIGNAIGGLTQRVETNETSIEQAQTEIANILTQIQGIYSTLDNYIPKTDFNGAGTMGFDRILTGVFEQSPPTATTRSYGVNTVRYVDGVRTMQAAQNAVQIPEADSNFAGLLGAARAIKLDMLKPIFRSSESIEIAQGNTGEDYVLDGSLVQEASQVKVGDWILTQDGTLFIAKIIHTSPLRFQGSIKNRMTEHLILNDGVKLPDLKGYSNAKSYTPDQFKPNYNNESARLERVTVMSTLVFDEDDSVGIVDWTGSNVIRVVKILDGHKNKVDKIKDISGRVNAWTRIIRVPITGLFNNAEALIISAHLNTYMPFSSRNKTYEEFYFDTTRASNDPNPYLNLVRVRMGIKTADSKDMFYYRVVQDETISSKKYVDVFIDEGYNLQYSLRVLYNPNNSDVDFTQEPETDFTSPRYSLSFLDQELRDELKKKVNVATDGISNFLNNIYYSRIVRVKRQEAKGVHISFFVGTYQSRQSCYEEIFIEGQKLANYTEGTVDYSNLVHRMARRDYSGGTLKYSVTVEDGQEYIDVWLLNATSAQVYMYPRVLNNASGCALDFSGLNTNTDPFSASGVQGGYDVKYQSPKYSFGTSADPNSVVFSTTELADGTVSVSAVAAGGGGASSTVSVVGSTTHFTSANVYGEMQSNVFQMIIKVFVNGGRADGIAMAVLQSANVNNKVRVALLNGTSQKTINGSVAQPFEVLAESGEYQPTGGINRIPFTAGGIIPNGEYFLGLMLQTNNNNQLLTNTANFPNLGAAKCFINYSTSWTQSTPALRWQAIQQSQLNGSIVFPWLQIY